MFYIFDKYMVMIIIAILLSGCSVFKSWDYDAIPDIKDNDEMIRYCTEMLKNTPDDPRYYFFRGLAYSYKGEPKNAINDYSKSIELNPYSNFTDANFNRGLDYRKQMQYENALKDFLFCIRRKRDYGNAYLLAGETYVDLKNYRDAEIYFQKAIRYLSGEKKKLAEDKLLDCIYYYQKNYKRAMNMAQNYFEKNQNDDIIVSSYVTWLLSCPDKSLQNHGLAEKISDDFLKKIHSPLSYYTQGKVLYYVKKKKDEAIAMTNAALELYLKSPGNINGIFDPNQSKIIPFVDEMKKTIREYESNVVSE